MDILLLPGFMLDNDLWTDVAPTLSRRHTLFFGDLSRNDTTDGMADTVLASAPSKFVLVGFSMGGYVAREIVRKAPERVVALILIATSGRADDEEEAARKARSVRRVRRDGFSGLSVSAVRATLHEANRSDERLIDRITAMAKRLGGGVFLRQLARAREGDLNRLLQIDCPTLIIASTSDEVRSIVEAEELRAGIRRSELLILQGAGHMLPLEVPDLLADSIADWIDKLG